MMMMMMMMMMFFFFCSFFFVPSFHIKNVKEYSKALKEREREREREKKKKGGWMDGERENDMRTTKKNCACVFFFAFFPFFFVCGSFSQGKKREIFYYS